MRLRGLARLLQIQRALVRHGLDDFVRATHLYRPFRFLAYLSPWTWFQRSIGVTRGERLRLALEELGPIFVKFGQALSTRRDLLPADIADELAKLQDRVPPFDSAIAVATIEKSFGLQLRDIFGSFEPKPLAAASIAQVHVATLKDGREVVVKILRPGMREIIDLDLEVLHYVAELADEYWGEARRLRPVELVREYRKTVLDELDLLREAGNAAQLKRNFAGSNLLYVPEVHWDYCRVDVMVMERIHGVIVNNLDELRARGTDIRKLAENGVEIFFTQVFRDNFFHADMHPGNIFVQIDDPQNPRYAAVDFGIVGTLQARDQHYLAENFMAFFDRDYARVAALHVESGWVPRGTRVDELESAVQQAAQGNLLRPGAAAAVRNRAPLRHAGTAAADPAAEDAVQYRRPRQATVPRARSLADGATLLAQVDARANESVGRAAPRSRAAARCPGGAATGAANISDRRARRHGGTPPCFRGTRGRGAAAR